MKYSKLPRIYINEQLEPEKIILLDANNYNYLKNVMRLKDGFNVRVFNEYSDEMLAQLNIDSKTARLKIKEKFRSFDKQALDITLIASVIKQDKLELMADMAVQIGVSRIIPLFSERSQRRDLNQERLNKIILEAARQSERFDLPVLEKSIVLSEIANYKFDTIFWANETEDENIVVKAEQNKKIAILIGPEGGFSEEEINYLNSFVNIKSVSLGANVLRSETAAIYLLVKLI